MPTREDRVFVKLALANGWIKPSQGELILDEVRRLERADGDLLPASEIAQQRRFLTPAQVRGIAAAVPYSIMRADDRLQIEILKKRKFATDEEITRAGQSQEKAFRADRSCTPLLAILLESGTVDEKQAEQVRSMAAKRAAAAAGAGPGGTPAVETSPSGSVPTEMDVGEVHIERKRTPLPNDAGFCNIVRITGGGIGTTEAHGLRQMLDALIARDDETGRRIILDMAGVSYMSSAGAGVIVGSRKEALDHGGDLRISNVRQPVKEVLHLTGISKIVKPMSIQAALKAFARGR